MRPSSLGSRERGVRKAEKTSVGSRLQAFGFGRFLERRGLEAAPVAEVPGSRYRVAEPVSARIMYSVAPEGLMAEEPDQKRQVEKPPATSDAVSKAPEEQIERHAASDPRLLPGGEHGSHADVGMTGIREEAVPGKGGTT